MTLDGSISGGATLTLLAILVPIEIWRALRYGYYGRPELQKDPRDLDVSSIFSDPRDKYTDEGRRDLRRRALSVTWSAMLAIALWLIADFLT